MNDFKNSWFIFLLGGIVAAFVTLQSLVFIIKAWREGKRIGLSPSVMKKALFSSGIFTIVPSLSIFMTVLTLAVALGLALPWIRLSVIGAITYELPAAEMAAQAFGTSINSPITDKVTFSAIAWCMSVGVLFNMLLVVFFIKKVKKGYSRILGKSRWSTLFIPAMFVGLISAFLGNALGNIVSALTLVSSAAIMVIFGILIKKTNLKILESFATPVSMIAGMALAILYQGLMGGSTP